MSVLAALRGGWRLAAPVALALVCVWFLGRCSVDADARCEARTASAAAAAAQADRAADAAAAEQRRTDGAAISTNSQAVKDATDALPDQAPTARQRTRACLLLRQQGATAAVLGTAGC